MTTQEKESLELAKAYAEKGYPVFPVRANKAPYTKNGFKDASTDIATIERWWRQRPDARVGISTGPAGIVVVDLDVKNGKDGITEWKQFDVPDSPYEVSTPSGGKHIYYQNDAAWTSSSDKLAPGVDIRAHGGYVVAYGPPPTGDLPPLPLIGPRPSERVSEAVPADQGDLPVSWDEILVPHGYSKCNELQWSRPGKDCSEGISIGIIPERPYLVKNFSGTVELPEGTYSKERLWETLNPGMALPSEPFAFPQRMSLVRAKEESKNQEWIIENVIEKKQRVSVAAPGGAMKSLVLLNLAVTLGLGLETLGTTPKEPVTVMYLDYENGSDDILDRIESMGFTAEQLDSPGCKLHIIHMPDYGPLDTKEGGEKLAAHAKHLGAELVIIDTLSKVTAGEENANETYAQVLMHTSNPLLQVGAAVLYLDHTGHSSNRARGASSKPQNVDIAFNVTRGTGAKEHEQYWDKRPEKNGKDRTGRGLKHFTLTAETTDGVLQVKLATDSAGESVLDKHSAALQFLHDHELLNLGPRPMWVKAEAIAVRPVGRDKLQAALKAWQDASTAEQDAHIWL